MKKVRAYVNNGFLSYLGLFPWATKRLILPTLVLNPILQLIAFTLVGVYLGSQPAGFYAVGNAVHATARAAIFAATVVVAAERVNGSLSTLVAAPTSILGTFAGRLIPPLLTGLFSSFVMISLALVFTDVPFSPDRLPVVLLAIVAVSASCSAFGLALGSVALYLRDVYFLPNIAVYGMMLFCGVNLASDTTTPLLTMIGDVLPLTHGLFAVREVLAGRAFPLGAVATELFIGVCCAAAACVLLRFFERRVRIAATLDLAG
ncbi:MAG TPA: ABC transporter permease [Candidatus Limnocylindrales bacterium]|nr:ABC transporter permease [Candidatus Limnocylindrales bacterium]